MKKISFKRLLFVFAMSSAFSLPSFANIVAGIPVTDIALWDALKLNKYDPYFDEDIDEFVNRYFREVPLDWISIASYPEVVSYANGDDIAETKRAWFKAVVAAAQTKKASLTFALNQFTRVLDKTGREMHGIAFQFRYKKEREMGEMRQQQTYATLLQAAFEAGFMQPAEPAAPKDWNCRHCTDSNPSHSRACKMCYALRD